MSPTRRRPFVPPAGRRIVGTPAEVAEDLGVPGQQVAAAITAAGLEAWGLDVRRRAVFRLADVERALGRPPPVRGRGDSWRSAIPGTAGVRGRQEPAALLADENPASGREKPPSAQESGLLGGPETTRSG